MIVPTPMLTVIIGLTSEYSCGILSFSMSAAILSAIHTASGRSVFGRTQINSSPPSRQAMSFFRKSEFPIDPLIFKTLVASEMT